MAYKLKNENLLKSQNKPDETANSAFINAVYQEKFGRKATEKEILHFQEKGASVKEVSDTVLREDSIFINPLNKKNPPSYIASGESMSPTQQELKNIEKAGGTEYELKKAAETGGGAGDTGKAPDITQPIKAKVKFKDSDAYKALTQDMKDFVDLSYNLIEVGGEDEAVMFKNAIEQAKGVADPYYAAQFTLALGEIQGQIAREQGNYDELVRITNETNTQLQKDMAAGKDLLGLNQTAELARLQASYQQDLLSIADQAAEKGLTMATGYRSRTRAEELRGIQQEDVVTSTNRQYNFQIQELTDRASRGDDAAKAKLKDLARIKDSNLSAIGRNAESILGSAGITQDIDPLTKGVQSIAGGTGYNPVTGVIGSNEENKKKSMISDIGGFLDLQKGFI